MEKYIIYCTEDQTMKALELGAPIEEDYRYDKDIMFGEECVRTERQLAPPTSEQMIGWLEEQGLFITIDKSDGGHIFYKILKETKYVCGWNSFSSRKEATIAAVDAALNYLKNQRN